MNYQELKNAIIEVIRTNGNEEITGEVLQFTLLEMVSSLGKDFQFAGVATPQTAITERDDKVAWVLGAGTYENFGIPFTVGVDEIAFVLYNGSYTVQKLKVGVVVDDTLTRDGQNPVKGGAIYAEFEKLRAAGYIFAGVTTPAGTPPQNLTEKIFYLCKEGGTYTNFGNLVLQEGLSVLKWNGSLWSADLIFGITDSVTENLASLLTSAGAYLAISAEATLREQGDSALRQDIADEVLARQQQGNTLQQNIDNEVLRAQGVEQQNANDIDALEALVPSQASEQNKLVDQQTMNSSIGTATATYRGAYNLVSDLSLTVEATHADIEAALALKMTELSITPDNNDYAFVQVPTSDETPTQIECVERYKFNGTVWLFEYPLNNSGFTAAQWAALNSGITSGLVTKLSDLPTYAELMTLLNGKQDVISDLQAIRSGAAKGETAYQKPVGGIPSEDMSSGVQSSLQKAENAAPQSTTYNKTEVDGMIGTIEEKIPSGASSQNKLVDQQTMNSSIATATATYRGAYNLVSDLSLTISATEQQIAAALATKMTALSITPDNNDYCYVQIPTSDATPTQIARVDRYKFNGTTWGFEYSLNNSGFTAAQWEALNSGITSGLVAKLSDLPSLSELTALLAGKQNTLTFDSTPTAGSNNPVTSNGIKQAIDAHTVVTDATPTAGSTNPVQSGGVKTYVDNKTDAQDTVIANAIAAQDDEIDRRMDQQDAEIDSRMDQQDAIISTLNGQDVIVVSSVPASGVANKIYRVYGTTSYSDYMFNADAPTMPIKIAEYSYPGVENTPTKGSQKLVSSGGLWDKFNEIDTLLYQIIDDDLSQATETGKYINSNTTPASITASAMYSYKEFFVRAGSIINVKVKVGHANACVLSRKDGENSYTPLITTVIGWNEFTYDVQESGIFAVSFLNDISDAQYFKAQNNDFINDLADRVDGLDDEIESKFEDAGVYEIVDENLTDSIVSGEAISVYGSVITLATCGYKEFYIKKGAVVTFTAFSNWNAAPIAKKLDDGSYQKLVEPYGGTVQTFEYTADENMTIAVSFTLARDRHIRIFTRIPKSNADNIVELIEYNKEFEDALGVQDMCIGYMLDRIAVAGDSMSVGSLNDNTHPSTYNSKGASWLSFLKKRWNCEETRHYAIGGESVYTWLTESHGLKPMLADETICNAYFIALGHNGTETLGDPTDEAAPVTVTEGVPSVPENLSFCAYYKAIINQIRLKAPHALILCLPEYDQLMVDTKYQRKEAIKEIADLYYNNGDHLVYHLDTGGVPISGMVLGGHYSTLGYMYIARKVNEELNKVIYAHMDDEDIKFFGSWNLPKNVD